MQEIRSGAVPAAICAGMLPTSVNDTRISGGRIISKTAVYDETGSIQLVFFNNKYISSMLRQGGEYFFYGKISSDSYGMQIVSPTFAPAVKTIQLLASFAGKVSGAIAVWSLATNRDACLPFPAYPRKAGYAAHSTRFCAPQCRFIPASYAVFGSRSCATAVAQ